MHESIDPNLPSGPNPPPNISVSLPAYRWHALLDVLQSQCFPIVNRNQAEAIEIYQDIATQLNGGLPVRVIHRDNPEPAYRQDLRAKEVKNEEVLPAPDSDGDSRRTTPIVPDESGFAVLKRAVLGLFKKQ